MLKFSFSKRFEYNLNGVFGVNIRKLWKFQT